MKNIEFEIGANNLDKINFGFFMVKSKDKKGEFRMIYIGFLVFGVSVYFYK